MAYYDCKKQRFIDDNEERKMFAEEPYFSEFRKIHRCIVCEERTWCNKNEKDKNGCNEFILNEMHIFAEVFKKQNKDKK